MATTEDVEHLYLKLHEVLGIRAATTLMELLADASPETAVHWKAINEWRH